MCSDAVVIPVNTDRPEDNREVQIFGLKDIDGLATGSQYFGYYIVHPMDLRYISRDQTIEHYKARVFTNNQILLTVPSWSFTLLMNRDEISPHVKPNVTDAMDDARHSFEDNKESRRWKHLLLEFPSDQTLSAKEIYVDAGEDEELELEIVPVTFIDDIDGKEKRVDFAGFTVARTDVRPLKKGKVEHKTNISKGAALLKSMLSPCSPPPTSS